MSNAGPTSVAEDCKPGGARVPRPTFTYADGLNRLTGYSVATPGVPGLERSITLQYNAPGMLLYKSDVGNYSYPTQGTASVRPHALQSVSSPATTSYTHDANGNLLSANGGKYRTIAYTSFNLPDSQSGAQGPSGTPKTTWLYDENHARIKEVHTDASGTRTTWYQHPDNQGGLAFESETAASGALSQRHCLSAAGQTVGVLVSTGAVTARFAWDPCGKRRQANGTCDAAAALVIDWKPTLNPGTDRGFIGHERLDDIGLVHMNGRLYDATSRASCRPIRNRRIAPTVTPAALRKLAKRSR